MYEEFHGLREGPFNLAPDPRFFYLGESQTRAIVLLKYCLDRGEGFLSVYGESGVGKTTLCNAVLNEEMPGASKAILLDPFLTEIDLLRTILAQFGALPEPELKGQAHRDLVTALFEFLRSVARRNGRAIVLIDRAHEMPVATLEQLRMLSNLETAKRKLLQIILVGEPQLMDTLARPDLRQLDQRISVRCEILPLSLAETSDYIHGRIDIASGGNPQVSFSREAIRLIHSGSGGIPRAINRICDRCLTVAMTARVHKINRKLAKTALKELNIEGPARRTPQTWIARVRKQVSALLVRAR